MIPAGEGPRSEERRNKLRIAVPFHAIVTGTDLFGEKFSVETVLDNISAGGLYMRIVPRVRIGSELSINVGLHPNSHVTATSPRFCVNGIVLRAEEIAGAACGVALAFATVKF